MLTATVKGYAVVFTWSCYSNPDPMALLLVLFDMADIDKRCSELMPPGPANEPYALARIVGFIDKSIITFFVVELKFIPGPAP